jgi:hypothetical protein
MRIEVLTVVKISLLGYDVVWTRIPMFRRSILSPSSGLKTTMNVTESSLSFDILFPTCIIGPNILPMFVYSFPMRATYLLELVLHYLNILTMLGNNHGCSYVLPSGLGLCENGA